MKMIKLACVVGFGTFAFGCGAPPEEGEMSDDLELAQDEQALSNGESCNTIAAHRTTTGEFTAFTTTSNYNPAGCHDGYLIDANDYDSVHHGGRHYLGHADPVTTPAECAKQRIGLYVWKRNSNGSTTFLGSKWRWGSWLDNGICYNAIDPTVDFGIGVSDTTVDYRFALSARTYDTAGDTGAPYTRKAIKSFWAPN